MARIDQRDSSSRKNKEAIAKSFSNASESTAASSTFDDDSDRDESQRKKNASSRRRRSRSRSRSRRRGRQSRSRSNSRSSSVRSQSSTRSGRRTQRTQRNQPQSSPDGKTTKPKSSRSKRKPPKKSSRSSEKQLQQQHWQRVPPNATPYSNSFAMLPPPDPSSSAHKSINLLVCTANLGNASPDADSWNAWIPKDGRLVPTTQFPVRMNPPPPAPPPPPQQNKNKNLGSPKRKSMQKEQQQQRNHSASFAGSKPRKPVRRGKSREPSDPRSQGTTTTTTTTRKMKKKEKPQGGGDNDDFHYASATDSNETVETQKDGYEAYLESLKGSAWSLNNSGGYEEVDDQPKSPTTTNPDEPREKEPRKGQKRQPGERERKRAPPRRTHSSQSPRPPREDKPRRETPRKGPPPVQTREPRRGVRRTRSNNVSPQTNEPTSPVTPKPRRPRSRSIDAASTAAAATQPQSPVKSPKMPTEKLRRTIRSKSNTVPSVQPENSSPKQRKFLRSKSSTQVVEKDGSARGEDSGRRNLIRSKSSRSKSPVRAGMVRSKSSRSKSPVRAGMVRSKSSRSKSPVRAGIRSRSLTGESTNNDDVPPCRRINEAEITRDEIKQIREFDIKYPRQAYGAGKNNSRNQRQLGCYDIIVIGMQEATFLTSKQQPMEEEPLSKQHKQQKKVNPSKSVSYVDGDNTDGDGDTDSEVDTDDDFTDDGSEWSDDGDTLDLDQTGDDESGHANGETNSSKSKKRLSQPKRGKSLKTKSGLLKKISKATSKTAKTIDNLAGGGKDYTTRPLLSTTPLTEDENPNNNAVLRRSDTLSSCEDEDFSLADTNTSANSKKWSDTDAIHHGIESNQLPGYTRALSYQFGQMRLLVYYKAGTSTDDVLQSLDVVSVSYQATGKAGLANKGGIVAEIAVNKTTKMSFLTAHLEAHEGAKHYKARNDSLQDILMETGSGKYFDASQSSHFTFAMGDLNYRTKLTDVAVGSDRHIQFSHNIVERRDWRILNQYDELQKSLTKQLCLAGFQTAYCNFPPTFKVGRQEGYKYNPQRSPSYTDRILFKNTDQLNYATKLLLYEPVEGFTSSDHKPIRSGFSIRLNRELRWKSTAELLVAEEESDLGDSLGDILPNTSKGNIHADRETMNIFVTNIECVVNPNNYDRIRNQDKAELPNPKVLFIAKPSAAVLLYEDPGKKRRFGLGSLSKSENDAAKKSKDVKIPSTPASKETMRPIWKEDHIYFALQTHTEHGRPIDFTGSQLHISLVDTKNSSSVIGSHCLNLAHLVICSRENGSRTLDRSKSHQNFDSPRSSQQKRLNSPTAPDLEIPRLPRRSEVERQGSRKLLSTSNHGSQRRLSERSGSSRRLSNQNDGSGGRGKPVKRGGPKNVPGYQLVPKPSPALRMAANSAFKYGNRGNSESMLPPAVKKAAEIVYRIESGSSKLYHSIMADLGGDMGKSSPKNSNGSSKYGYEEFGLRSLRLHEPLIEGGLVTGHIKCDIDVWWT